MFSVNPATLSRESETMNVHLVSGQYSYSERPDAHRLVVYNRQGNDLLWVRYVNA
jgi:hypothetical protein